MEGHSEKVSFIWSVAKTMKCMVLAAVVAPTRSVAASRHSGPSCPRLSWAPPGRPLADLAVQPSPWS